MSIVVIIPIYKSIPDQFELISFKQGIDVLRKHTICIITYRTLDLLYYLNLLDKERLSYKIEYFEDKYFESILGYNRLMLSLEFYKRFSMFDYMLIYQLDAYVFRDELDYWCNLHYDYLGAPWINNGVVSSYGGNGGFSLRKISSFIKVLQTDKKIVYNPRQLIIQYEKYKLHVFFNKIPLITARIFGYKNNSKFYIQFNNKTEDVFWAYRARFIYSKFKVIEGDLAVKFAFEEYPSILYKYNNNQLPFGCHAWTKYDSSFWRDFIIKG